MARTIMICGFGPGISTAVARKFGEEGFQVALVARSAERLEQGVATLSEAGITAKGFACDLGDPAAVTRLVADVREGLGPVTVIHWNAYAGVAGDLTTCDLQEVRTVFDVGVVGAVAAIQAALPDLSAAEGAAVLVTGGGFSTYAPQVDQVIAQWSAMGLALAKAAQHKLTGIMHAKLASRGIYVGTVVVKGLVKHSALGGEQGLEPEAIAATFWSLYQGRTEVSVDFP
ncbi:MAG: SDR family NAD(P)-dependent oxidoreductase [Myxococcales bacterium]|nr:SDR family NAD(P)-dependent oxidoreductase [Myxococcales bacterium]